MKPRFCSPRPIEGPIAKVLHRSRVGHDNEKTPTLREVARHIPRSALSPAISAHSIFVLLAKSNIAAEIHCSWEYTYCKRKINYISRHNLYYKNTHAFIQLTQLTQAIMRILTSVSLCWKRIHSRSSV